jgi:hypothetical protein
MTNVCVYFWQLHVAHRYIVDYCHPNCIFVDQLHWISVLCKLSGVIQTRHNIDGWNTFKVGVKTQSSKQTSNRMLVYKGFMKATNYPHGKIVQCYKYI